MQGFNPDGRQKTKKFHAGQVKFETSSICKVHLQTDRPQNGQVLGKGYTEGADQRLIIEFIIHWE